MNKSLNPEYVISSTDRLLGSGVNLGWEDGLKVLEIIRQIILHHLPSVATGADDLHARVQSLLRHVVEHVQNVDIRDRANLYMRFVEGLPSDEREKFICPSCSSSELNVVDPNLSVTQEIDSTSQSEEVLSKIIEFAKNFEKRKKLGIMDGNWAVFESGKIGLPFTLRFRHNFPDSDVPSALFGVEISFSICEGFVPFESVRIPYLERPTTCGTAEGFPYSYDINLTLQALCPMPAEFRVEIVFTDINGKFHRGELEPFSVEFEDLFMPCQDWGKNFVQKWNNPFAKLLPLGKDFIDKMICERLNHFLVPPKMKGKGKICEEELAPLEPFDFEHETLLHGTSEPSEPPTTRNVLIFIPPDSYLLMRFVMGDTTCVVWIATDRSDLLLLLDAFFDKWISASPPGTSSKRNDPLHASDERFISS
jgi:hypothetical protein